MADDKRDKIQMTLKDGVVVIETRPDVAPKHVDQIKKLITDKQYDGVVFHRVIDGFMAQTGDVEFGNSSNETFAYHPSSYLAYSALATNIPDSS